MCRNGNTTHFFPTSLSEAKFVIRNFYQYKLFLHNNHLLFPTGAVSAASYLTKNKNLDVMCDFPNLTWHPKKVLQPETLN